MVDIRTNFTFVRDVTGIACIKQNEVDPVGSTSLFKYFV